ncbi:hypothetical protein [Peribacillus kribbensis]|nr:hypothetical protein [Peribacillus kribbensis]
MYFCLACGRVLLEEEAFSREDQSKLCLHCYMEHEEEPFPHFYD